MSFYPGKLELYADKPNTENDDNRQEINDIIQHININRIFTPGFWPKHFNVPYLVATVQHQLALQIHPVALFRQSAVNLIYIQRIFNCRAELDQIRHPVCLNPENFATSFHFFSCNVFLQKTWMPLHGPGCHHNCYYYLPRFHRFLRIRTAIL